MLRCSSQAFRSSLRSFLPLLFLSRTASHQCFPSFQIMFLVSHVHRLILIAFCLVCVVPLKLSTRHSAPSSPCFSSPELLPINAFPPSRSCSKCPMCTDYLRSCSMTLKDLTIQSRSGWFGFTKTSREAAKGSCLTLLSLYGRF